MQTINETAVTVLTVPVFREFKPAKPWIKVSITMVQLQYSLRVRQKLLYGSTAITKALLLHNVCRNLWDRFNGCSRCHFRWLSGNIHGLLSAFLSELVWPASLVWHAQVDCYMLSQNSTQECYYNEQSNHTCLVWQIANIPIGANSYVGTSRGESVLLHRQGA